jgi:hypothetical protein
MITILIQELGGFFFPSLSFPPKRESRNTLREKLDSRLRGNDRFVLKILSASLPN